MTSNLSTPAHPAAMVAELAQQEQQANNSPTSPPTRPSPIITTPRLIIRPLYPPDAPELVKACEPASITKYMTLAFAYPYTLSHAETWISMNLAPPINHFTICEADKPDVPIGGVGIKPGADVQAHTGEVGYWVREEVQGRGYATEALRAIVEWGFGKVEGGREYKRLWAGVFAENKASMHILEKVGFVQEGIQKGHIEKHGVVMDAHLFGLTKADWEKQPS